MIVFSVILLSACAFFIIAKYIIAVKNQRDMDRMFRYMIDDVKRRSGAYQEEMQNKVEEEKRKIKEIMEETEEK